MQLLLDWNLWLDSSQRWTYCVLNCIVFECLQHSVLNTVSYFEFWPLWSQALLAMSLQRSVTLVKCVSVFLCLHLHLQGEWVKVSLTQLLMKIFQLAKHLSQRFHHQQSVLLSFLRSQTLTTWLVLDHLLWNYPRYKFCVSVLNNYFIFSLLNHPVDEKWICRLNTAVLLFLKKIKMVVTCGITGVFH